MVWITIVVGFSALGSTAKEVEKAMIEKAT
jgi:hypothetical protein